MTKATMPPLPQSGCLAKNAKMLHLPRKSSHAKTAKMKPKPRCISISRSHTLAFSLTPIKSVLNRLKSYGLKSFLHTSFWATIQRQQSLLHASSHMRKLHRVTSGRLLVGFPLILFGRLCLGYGCGSCDFGKATQFWALYKTQAEREEIRHAVRVTIL
jgi:hypothetical protein